jgi:hypothetical protein
MSYKPFTLKSFVKYPAASLLFLGLFFTSLSLQGKESSTSFDNPPSVVDTCYYTLELFDSFGDGWNGSFLTITINGVSTDYTFTTGTEATFMVAAISNAQFIATYTAGAFQNEVTYNILDPSGNVIFSDGPFPQTGEVLNIFACPTCPGPYNVIVEDVGGIDADLSWTAADSSGVYLLEYDTTGFALGTGNTLTTSNTSINLTGLQENTAYDFYISVACDNGDSSAVIGPTFFKTIWLIDVGISNILTPQTQCGLTDDETVEVTIKNYGDLPQSLIPFKYSVNGVDAGVPFPVDGFFTGVISNDSTTTLEFETTFDFSEFGEYTIDAWTELENDSDINNDSFSFTITNIPVVTDLPYFTDFEDWDGGWKKEEEISMNSTWDYGEPVGPIISSAASGINAWVTNLSGNYNNSELSYFVSPCYDFTDLNEDPVINFSVNYNTELNWDGGWLEGSIDGGMTWSKIGSMGTGVNWYNFNNTIQNLGDVWAGNSNGWLIAENTLIGFAGESDCRFRFAFDSDGSVNNYDGIGVDNVFISPIFEDDLSMITANHESVSDCGSEEDKVFVEIRNAGSSPQFGFDVSYQVNGGNIITENVGALIVNPGAIESYTFTTPFDSKVFGTTFEIVAWTDLSTELNFINDTTSFEFNTVTPDALPLVEDFENITLPPGWTSTGFITNAHNNVSYVMSRNLYSGVQTFQMTTSNIGPINPGDSLTFDYRYTNWSAGTVAAILGAGDSLQIQVSTDCGDSFTTVFTVNQSNHIESNVMANKLVDLDQFGGEVIKIRFVANWGTGDYWLDIDNINIIGCPQSLAVEFQTNYESSAGASDGSIIVNPTQGQAPYNYQWSDPNAPDNLGEGTYVVTITDANGCMEITTVELGVCPDNLDLSSEVTHVSEEGASDGKITILAGGGEGPYTYEWDTGDSTAVVSGLPVGEYIITVTDVHSCSDIITVTVDVVVAVDELNILSEISLIPNPTSDISTLNIELNQIADIQVQLINLVGQILFYKENKNTNSMSYQIDLNDYPEGIYFVRIQFDDQLFIEKLVRAR